MVSLLPDVSMIREIRKSLGISQAELAEYAGISRTSLVKLENLKADLSYGKVKRIFDVLEVHQRKNSMIDSVTLGMIHSVPFVSLDVKDTMNKAYIRFHESDYSQFVVTEGDRIVGSITDRKAFGALTRLGDVVKDDKVGEYMEEPFPVLSVNTPVIKALPLIQTYQAVLTRDKEGVTGIATNNDVGKIFLNEMKTFP